MFRRFQKPGLLTKHQDSEGMNVVKRTGGAELRRRKPEPRRRDMRVMGVVQKGSGARPREPELRTGHSPDRGSGKYCYIPSQKGKERPPGSPDVDASLEHPEEGRRFSCRLFSQHHSSEGYRKGCRVIRRMPEATGGKLVEADRLCWSPTQCNRLCGSGTRPGRDPSDRKRSGRSAWEPGLICDSAGDSEDARKGTGEAPNEVEGSRPETGKGLSQEPDDWSEE
ncbi:hypothetical protein B0H11DRAFT_2207125 [Mycena galericulata]|nr:hypothetical protein B0H11DRAFT_2207125 [Mycena galericulata]